MASMVTALGAIALAAAIYVAPRSSGTHVAVRTPNDGIVRVRDGAAQLRVALWCDRDSAAEIDAVLEQRSTGLRVARVVSTPCGRSWRTINLVFERRDRRFRQGDAHLALQAMAGFGETFGAVQVRTRTELVAAARR